MIGRDITLIGRIIADRFEKESAEIRLIRVIRVL